MLPVTLATTPLVGYRLFLREQLVDLEEKYVWRSLTMPALWAPGQWNVLDALLMTPAEWHTCCWHGLNILERSLKYSGDGALASYTRACHYSRTKCLLYTPDLYKAWRQGHAYRMTNHGEYQRVQPGFFAFRTAEDFSFEYNMRPDYESWAVEMAGTVEEYKQGYRAQRMRMVRPV